MILLLHKIQFNYLKVLAKIAFSVFNIQYLIAKNEII